MTRRIRKDAPEGATHFATISGKLKYVKIDESGKQFIYASGWIPSVFLDERFNLNALKLEINQVFYAVLSMVAITCFVVWFMFWGAK